MTDYSNEEINALEYVFPEREVLNLIPTMYLFVTSCRSVKTTKVWALNLNCCKVFICDFHREQAWERWLSKTINGCCLVKDQVKKMLRDIAHAKTEDICQKAVQGLQESQVWKIHQKLAEYLTNTWLPIQKRWVFAYRQDRLLLNVNTNNGTESYCDKNKKAHSSYRKYNAKIPPYLIDRPRPLVKHCMHLIDTLKGLDLQGINAVTDKIYNVASFDSNSREIYKCYLDDDKHLPSCSCPAWFSSPYPCKHFFAIFIKENLS
ncbi:uncharacterized protein LOC136096743 [Hydra vulgaris]|uniref:uncharacterized protein LOC136096743 n=1 Tax=Hydra vulgaris TaxID=6087 RepID=UPI0032EA0D03